MRYGIIGLRDFNGKLYENSEYMASVLEGLKEKGMASIISGGGKGVEKLVEEWAKTAKVECKIILPNIKAHGKRDAFLLRNLEILKQCDEMIIFWDGVHSGVIRPIGNAMTEGKSVRVIPVK